MKIRRDLYAKLRALEGRPGRKRGVNEAIEWLLDLATTRAVGPILAVEQLGIIAENTTVCRIILEAQGNAAAPQKYIVPS